MKKIKVYGIPNCGSIKKTKTLLDELNVAYTFINYKKEPATRSLLNDWFEQKEWLEFINKKGMTWRRLSDEQRSAIVDSTAAIASILENNSLIKRPVITIDDQVSAIGFDESLLKKLF